MGFSHYVNRPAEDHDQKEWNEFVKACKKLHKHMPKHSHSSGDDYGEELLFINGCTRYQYPKFNKDIVYFNGGVPGKRIKVTNCYGQDNWKGFQHEDKELAKKNEALAHETFMLTRKHEEIFHFCKTARKPYDLMAQACMILYKYFFPEVRISSDGNEVDWEEAKKFVAHVHPHIATKMFLGSTDVLGK